MSKRKLTATMPDGTILTRTTEKPYRYAVAFQRGGRVMASWATTLHLAQKRNGIILPVNETFPQDEIDSKAQTISVNPDIVTPLPTALAKEKTVDVSEQYTMTAEEFQDWTKDDTLEDLRWKLEYATEQGFEKDAALLAAEIQKRMENNAE